MIPGFAADSFKLLTRLLGLLHLKERNRQRKTSPERELRINLEGGAELSGSHFVSIVSQGVVSSAQMIVRRVWGRRLCSRLCLRFRTCAADGAEYRRGYVCQNPRLRSSRSAAVRAELHCCAR